MKLKMKHKITFEEADRLIESYYEGTTSVEEEKRLHAFLSSGKLPEKYAAEQAIFGYFDNRKNKQVFVLRPYIKWIGSVAAAMVILVAGLQFIQPTYASYAYVDGKKITNVEQIKAHALSSLGDVSDKNDEVTQTLNDVTDNQLIKQQLDVFAGLGE